MSPSGGELEGRPVAADGRPAVQGLGSGEDLLLSWVMQAPLGMTRFRSFHLCFPWFGLEFP